MISWGSVKRSRMPERAAGLPSPAGRVFSDATDAVESTGRAVEPGGTLKSPRLRSDDAAQGTGLPCVLVTLTSRRPPSTGTPLRTCSYANRWDFAPLRPLGSRSRGAAGWDDGPAPPSNPDG